MYLCIEKETLEPQQLGLFVGYPFHSLKLLKGEANEMVKKDRIPEVAGGFNVLGVVFQGFVHPETNQVVFSLRGVSRGLEIHHRQVARILGSEAFKSLSAKAFNPAKLLTTAARPPISVVTQTDLTFLVKIASKKGYPVAESMQDASFAVLLQQSIDVTLKTQRNLTTYLEAGTTLQERMTERQQATPKDKRDYRKSYQDLKATTFENGYGVRGLCEINRSVFDLAVPDAPERRAKSKSWRNKCSSDETAKIIVGNMVHKKAVNSAADRAKLEGNLAIVRDRTSQIIDLMDAPL